MADTKNQPARGECDEKDPEVEKTVNSGENSTEERADNVSPVVDADDEESSTSSGEGPDSDKDDEGDDVVEEGANDGDSSQNEGDAKKTDIKESTEVSKGASLIFCDVCTLYCRGERAYQNHVAGLFHSRELTKKQQDLLAGCSEDGNKEPEQAEPTEKKTVFKCEVCSKDFRAKDNIKIHYRTTTHRQKLKTALCAGQEVTDIVINLDLDDHTEPLLGLEHLVETFTCQNQQMIEYTCEVCDANRLTPNHVFQHLKGFRHCLNYLTKYHPEWKKKLGDEIQKDASMVQKAEAFKYAAEVEKLNGRGCVKKVRVLEESNRATKPKGAANQAKKAAATPNTKKPRGKMYSDLLLENDRGPKGDAKGKAEDAKGAKKGDGKKKGDKKAEGDAKGGQRGGRGSAQDGGARNKSAGGGGGGGGRGRAMGGQNRMDRNKQFKGIPSLMDYSGYSYGGMMQQGSQGYGRSQGRGRGLLMQQMASNPGTYMSSYGQVGQPNLEMMSRQMMNRNMSSNMGMGGNMTDRRMPSRDIRVEYGLGFSDFSTQDDFSVGRVPDYGMMQRGDMMNSPMNWNSQCYPGDLWQTRGRGAQQRGRMNTTTTTDNAGYRKAPGGYPSGRNDKRTTGGQGNRTKDNTQGGGAGSGRKGQQREQTSGKSQNEENNTKKKLLSMIDHMTEQDAKVVLQVADVVYKH